MHGAESYELNAIFGLWWVDPVAALIMLPSSRKREWKGYRNREANPNEDTRSSRPRSAGDRALDLGLGLATGCLSKQSPSVGAFGIAAIGSASPATRGRPSQGI